MTEQPSTYRVVFVEPGKPGYEKEIGTDLSDLQEAVGGDIQLVYPYNDGTILVCNEEGKLMGLEGNRRLDNGAVIAGSFFIIGDDRGNFRSLTDAEVSRHLQKYAEPQQISQREVQADMGTIIISY